MSLFHMPTGDLLIAPAYRTWAENCLTELARYEPGEDAALSADVDFWDERLAWARPYNVKDGVLTIPVQGMLLNKFPYQFGSWATGYEYIEAAVQRGVADSNVQRIVLDVNSPGGLVSGCFDCADAIYNARGEKPILAASNEHAYSAAYAIISAADHITVARTGGVGSIGVITMHVDYSEALERQGVKVTLIHAGEQKADGSPYKALSDDAKARIQARVDNSYSIFVASVARNRDIDEQAVRDTEAGLFMAHEAVENGLADAIGTLDSLSAFADPLETDEDEEMSNPDTSTVEQAVTPEALAEAEATAKTEGVAEGRTSERERIAAIMDSDEAKARPALARHFAMNTDMDPEAAKAALAAAAEETKEGEEEGSSAFENAMETGDNPELGAEGGAEMSEDEAFLAEFYSYRA